jgi:beta-glucosidase
VNHAYVVSLIEGLKNAGFSLDASLQKSYEQYIPEAKSKMPKSASQFASFLPKKLIPEMDLSNINLASVAKANDVAVITIGKTSGEFGDRSIKTNFNLTTAEEKMISDVTTAFHKVGKR